MQPSEQTTGLREECGVFGIFDTGGSDVSADIFYGLCALQHRGQESCGIAVGDTNGPMAPALCHKGLGLVQEVFTPDILARLTGNIGIGHVRYATTGAATLENAQPLVLNYIKGTLTLAHNGNLVNAAELKRELEKTGAVFQTTIDSEAIALHIARERLNTSTVEDAIKRAAAKIKGAYGLVIASPRKLIGVRDPYGLKPLCLGRMNHAWLIASESCAIEAAGGEFIRDITPGEIVTITKEGLHSDTELRQTENAHCIFEYIYFARLDSRLDRVSVYEARLRGGAILARSGPVSADLVAGVPDSGLTAAMGYSRASGIPFELIFHKNSYVGRTFIKSSQKERENSVKIKLSVLAPAVKGKRIVLVDDSIVRGTTIKNLIHMLKEAGALEVHVRISSPPFLYPCYFGTDVPSNRQLIASSHSMEEIRRSIGADSLAYMPAEQLPEMTGGLPLCTACFTGHYPMEVPGMDIKNALEKF